MIAATTITVSSINHPDSHRRYVTLTGFLDEPRKLARSGIVFTADTASSHCLGLRLVRRHTFGENTNRMSVTNAIAAQGATDDVVSEHCFDVHIIFLRFFRKVSCAKQALLFSWSGHEID